MKYLITNFILIICLLCFSFYGCKCQDKRNTSECYSDYQAAKQLLERYYYDDSTPLLWEALTKAEAALKCEELKAEVSELKIGLLMQLKSSDRGIAFIDSLDERIFKYPYRKKMSRSLFLTINSNPVDSLRDFKLYTDVVAEIERFLKEDSVVGSINKEVYFDLFLIKQKFMTEDNFNAEIDAMIKKHPEEQEFFESLKESFIEEIKEARPIIKNN